MIYELSFRGAGGSVVPGLLSEHGSPGSPVKGDRILAGYRRVVFIIHGFNVDEQKGRISLSRMAEHLDEDDSATVFVLWPGDSPIGPLSYPFTEGHQANDTAAQLVRFIDSQVGENTPLNFIAHSLGCRVVLESVNQLYKKAGGEQSIYPVHEVCLLAAAVDDFCLSVPKKYKISVERVKRIVVLSSVEDEVLRFVYPAGDLLQAFLFFWKESAGFALGYRGPKTLKTGRKAASEDEHKRQFHHVASNVVSIKIEKRHGVDHGDYLPPGKIGKPENDQQRASVNVTSAALAGVTDLTYPI